MNIVFVMADWIELRVGLHSSCVSVFLLAIDNSYWWSYLQHSAALKLSHSVVFTNMIEYVAYTGIAKGIRDVWTSFSIQLEPLVITSSFSDSYLVHNPSKIVASTRIAHHGVLWHLLWSMSWIIESIQVFLFLSSLLFLSLPLFLSFSLFPSFSPSFSPRGYSSWVGHMS